MKKEVKKAAKNPSRKRPKRPDPLPSEVIARPIDIWRLFRKTPWILGGIFFFAFILRFVFVCQWFTTPYGEVPYLDAHMYDSWARDILRGHWLRSTAFYQSPLFPYVLALLYGVFGRSLWLVALVNALLGAAVCTTLARATGRIFGIGAALLTGLMAALYRPFIFYTAPVLKETLEIFLLALFLLAFMKAIGRNREKNLHWKKFYRSEFLHAGLWLGLAVLTRGNVVMLALAVMLLTLIRWKHAGWRACGYFAAGVIAVILPVTLHNAWVSHDFVPVTYASGFNFYIGNREGADGGAAYPAEVATGASEEISTTQRAEAIMGRPLKPSEISAVWMDLGFDFIARHPEQAAFLYARKLALFFSNTEISDNYNLGFFARHMGTLMAAPLPGFALVLGLAVFGVAASRREKRREIGLLLTLAGFYLLSVMPFYVTDRYRLPVVVFILPLAGATAPALRGLVRARNWGRLALLEGVAIACAVASVLFPSATAASEVTGWAGLSDIEFSMGRDTEGLDYLQKAIDVSPRDVGVYFYMNGVCAEDRRNDHDKALQLLDEAVASHPLEAASMEESYGRFLLDRNNAPAALKAFGESARIMPGYAAAFAGMARAQQKLGDRAAALKSARYALALDPGDAGLIRLVESLTPLGR